MTLDINTLILVIQNGDRICQEKRINKKVAKNLFRAHMVAILFSYPAQCRLYESLNFKSYFYYPGRH